MMNKYRMDKNGVTQNKTTVIKICPVCKRFFKSKRDSFKMCFECNNKKEKTNEKR